MLGGINRTSFLIDTTVDFIQHLSRMTPPQTTRELILNELSWLRCSYTNSLWQADAQTRIWTGRHTQDGWLVARMGSQIVEQVCWREGHLHPSF